MKYDPDIHHRRSIRLKGYDYSQVGAYFVTICAQNRECLFGEILDGEMALNDPGWMIETIWHELPEHYPGVGIDAFQVMPNHMHGIVIVGAGPRACPDDAVQTPNTGQPRGVAPTLSLPDVVHRFKSLTTKRYIDGVKQKNWLAFRGKLWQRNYYEHIVRNDDELNRIREYIVNNPLQWEMDRENPNGQRDIGQAQGQVQGQAQGPAPTKDEPWRT